MNGGMPDVLVCITLLRSEEKQLVRAIEEKGLEVEICIDKAGLPCVSARGQLPRIALIRSMSHRTALNMASLLESAGVRSVNSVRAISLCSNKALQSVQFRRNGIPHPEFRISFRIADVEPAGQELGGDYIVKPVDASWGRGIARIRNAEEYAAWAAGRESVDASEKTFPLLIQRYVNKGNFDLRVVIVGRTPIAAFKRVSQHWKTNTHLGAKVEPIPISDRIQALCQQVLSVLGEGFYGLDLLDDVDSGELLVCEVNQNPEFDKSSAIHGIDVHKYVASYIVDLIETKDAPAEPRSDAFYTEGQALALKVRMHHHLG